MSNHTPGPWRLGETWLDVINNEKDPCVIAWCDPPDIATIPNRKEQWANARLIAAAPDMLDELIRLRDVLIQEASGYGYEHDHPANILYQDIQDLQDVISRATGEKYH